MVMLDVVVLLLWLVVVVELDVCVAIVDGCIDGWLFYEQRPTQGLYTQSIHPPFAPLSNTALHQFELNVIPSSLSYAISNRDTTGCNRVRVRKHQTATSTVNSGADLSGVRTV
jgi:hypothetical protein